MEASSHFEADPLTREIIASAIEVHKSIGPGLIESIYEEALCYELYLRGIEFERQIPTDVIYKGRIIKGQRIDLIIRAEVIIELKSVSRIHEVVFAQILSYLKATNLKRGLIMNFGEKKLVDGIRRVVN